MSASRVLIGVGVALVVAIFILPIAWMISTSFKRTIDIIAVPPKIFFVPVWDYYRSVLGSAEVLKSALNSVIATSMALVISFALGVPAAYAMARYNFRGKKVFYMWILTGLMIPLASLIVPFYLMFQATGLLDRVIGLIVVYLLIDIPFIVWMLGAYFKDVPVELDESARLDGCGTLRLLVGIILPVSKPGIASAAISCVIATWNEFLFAMILTQTKAKTAPVVITGFMSTSGMRWGEMAAVATLLMIPPVVFGMSIQKSYIRGLTAGSIKM